MASHVVAGVKRSFAAMAADKIGDMGNRQAYHHPCNEYASPRRKRNNQAQLRRDMSPDVNSAAVSRGSSSSPQTPRSTESATARFDADASMVLVGMRGSGKSTLAIIASTAMKRRIVETEKAFHEETGLSTTAFKKRYGSLEYHRRQYSVLQGILSSHQKESIIVTSWMERSTQTLLENFAASHPVIHIVRDQKSIAEYLGVTDEGRIKFQELIDYGISTFRACGNFEFFNLSEQLPRPGKTKAAETTALDCEAKAPAPYLTLKRAERHFLKFLSLIMPRGTIPYIESAFPLASIPTEKRRFTYAVSVPLSSVMADTLDIQDMETGADAVEVVVDDAFHQPLDADRASRISRAIGHIRRNVVIPIIYHVTWPPSQGDSPSTSRLTTYLEHIQHGLRLAPEYITVDLRLDDHLFSQIVECKKTSKVIGTVNLKTPSPPVWTDDIWISYYRKAHDLGCDLVRLLRPAIQVEDNFEINSLRYAIDKMDFQPPLPLIAFNLGPKGRNSQCFNQVLTSVMPKSFAGRNLDEEDIGSTYITPAITATEATTALYSSFITDAMKLYVFGANVGYSLSPAMHNTALKACGIAHEYRPYSTNSLGDIRDLIHDPLFAGASIGLPFKVEVISLTHSLSSHAKAIGAVNTLIPVRHLNADGSIPADALFFNCRNRAGPVLALYGENTDWIGIRACIRRGLSPANAVRPSSSGLVIGAGGMARAAVYAMLQLGVENIAIYNRTASNADKLVSHFTRLLRRNDLPLLGGDGSNASTNTRFHVLRTWDEAWPETRFRQPTMIVSCIPTHAIGNCPAPRFVLPAGWMQSPTGGVVVELAYKYLNTPLLDQVRAEAHRGWVPMDGLDLLPEQGFAQFELFTGRRAPRRLMRGEVFRSYPDSPDEDGGGAEGDGEGGGVVGLGRSNQTQLQPRLEGIVEQEP